MKIKRLWGNEDSIRKKLEEALKKLPYSTGMIIDLRGNGGGNDQLAKEFISKFMSHAYVYRKISIRLSGDVLEQRPHYKKMYKPDFNRPGYSNGSQ